ncbi:MAG TPA: tRNA (adenosine(37)-N6)-dimethylallyltransferase MiaA, partial [Propionicimonas sp.]|nr:tRNA (adenosine(37)-N6)-dimethylallyltransferase MiaA [Propionicimonas sp.]
FLGGVLTEAEALQATSAGMRRLSRNQMGWIRRDPRIVWLPADDAAAATMASAVRGRVLLGS